MAKEMTFWEHLDELRAVIFRSLLVVLVLMVLIFIGKDIVFGDIIFAPIESDFILYRIFDSQFSLQLINIDLAAQFFTHIKVSFYLGFIIALPFIFYQIWSFISPALYYKEKKSIRSAFGFASILFFIGVLVGYFLVFPLTIRFLGTYQVSPDVPNQISLNSYISMFLRLILVMGIVFEMPALAAVLSRMGIITRDVLKKYRKHAVVVLLVLAAIITPSGDAFTLMIVGVPLCMLYEVSILVCKPAEKEEEEL